VTFGWRFANRNPMNRRAHVPVRQGKSTVGSREIEENEETSDSRIFAGGTLDLTLVQFSKPGGERKTVASR
jgi:hypothetical protein